VRAGRRARRIGGAVAFERLVIAGMLFPTIDFAIFFAVAFTANWLLNPYPRSWKLAMIAASYLFYS
jgi:hypothetical protein